MVELRKMSIYNNFMNSTIICNEKKDVDIDALNLLAQGEVAQLCSCAYKNNNKHHHFIYDTNDLIPLPQLQAGLSFENVVDLLSSAADMIKALFENSLILDNVKNSKEYIFRADTNYKFVYIPITQNPRLSVRDFITKLISVAHHKDVRLGQFVKTVRKKKDNEEALAYLTAFVSSYDSHYGYFDETTSLLSNEGETSLLGNENATSLLRNEAETSLLISNTDISENDTSLLSDDGDTTILSQANYNGDCGSVNTAYSSAKLTERFHDESEACETTVLTSQPIFQNQPANESIESKFFLCLIRNANGEKITVDVTPFTIGKDTANMDFVLNNDSVSRHHATIIYENGDYFIMDNNSTNGTTIEGIRLQPGEKGEIGNGYIVSLGSESFHTHIEGR